MSIPSDKAINVLFCPTFNPHNKNGDTHTCIHAHICTHVRTHTKTYGRTQKRTHASYIVRPDEDIFFYVCNTDLTGKVLDQSWTASSLRRFLKCFPSSLVKEFFSFQLNDCFPQLNDFVFFCSFTHNANRCSGDTKRT